MKLRRQLIELVGPDDADKMISGLSMNDYAQDDLGLLASMGPILGIAKIAHGEISREEYLARYGHRGPSEFELSVPRPLETSRWLDKQLEDYRKSPVNIEGLLEKKRNEFKAALDRFQAKHPLKAKKMIRLINKVASLARWREAVRSEYVRDRWVVRTFALRAGELTGLGDEMFFLTLEEVLNLLAGEDSAVDFTQVRMKTIKGYSDLPTYPPIIRGRFDPFRWAV